MSDASKKLFKTLTPLALFIASQCSAANATGTIQIVGPEGKDQTVSSQVVTQSQPTRAVTTTTVQERKSSPAKVYGPTREDETLWSIADRINPSNTTSVQQTLLAIYRLNPHAFENNNIHGLEPNSRLKLPTLAQVRRENTDDAKQLLLSHQKKLADQKNAERNTAVQAKKEITPTLNTVKPTVADKKPVKETVKLISPTAASALTSELDITEQEFSALQENNHQLRVRLAEVQNEVDNLKNSLGDEERIRNEVEKFINEQKQLAAAEKKAEPSTMDNLASSPGLIALLALVPGALIAGLIAFFLSRRKKEEDENTENTQTEQPSPLIMPDDHFNLDDDIPEISLDDDDDDILAGLNDDEFLFGYDDSDLNDDLFAEFETENKEIDNEDPFVLLDGEGNDELDSMLSDEELNLDGLDDIDMSSSALTVDSEEKALGLEEMEKALNDFDSDLFLTSDLEEEDDDFDLSLIDDSEFSAPENKSIAALDENEDLEGGELSQSMLDDLFSSMEMDDDLELDQGWDLDEKEETKLVPESTSNSVEDELDFDTLLSGIEDNNRVEESDKEDSIDLGANEDSFDLDIRDDSTALLDELLGDEELSDDDDGIEIDEDSTALLDEFLSDEEDDDIPELDEDSTVLLDELLGDDVEEEENTQGKSGDDSEVEGVAVSELLSEDTPREEDWLVEADEDEDDDIPLFESDIKQNDVSLELEESVEKESPSLEATEQVQDSELVTETDDEILIEDDEVSFELDDLLEPEAELESKQVDVQPELEDPLEQNVPSLEAAENVQESELAPENDDELKGEFTEQEELDIENDDLLTEENEFSLDDFLENSAADFSTENEEILPQSDDVENDNSSFEGLSIEDALASLEDDKDVENINSEFAASDEIIQAEPVNENEVSDTEDESTVFDFQSRVSDEEKEALAHLDSSGLDLDSMLDDGGSDWSGFNLDNTTNTDSELEDEDWSEQPSVENDPHGADRFLSIEALIAESENGDKSEFEEEEFNLDVGLDEFPDMLNSRELHDVDVNNDIQSKLDLARAYIEMSDKKGALELLEDVLDCDDQDLKAEAEKLMKQID